MKSISLICLLLLLTNSATAFIGQGVDSSQVAPSPTTKYSTPECIQNAAKFLGMTSSNKSFYREANTCQLRATYQYIIDAQTQKPYATIAIHTNSGYLSSTTELIQYSSPSNQGAEFTIIDCPITESQLVMHIRQKEFSGHRQTYYNKIILNKDANGEITSAVAQDLDGNFSCKF